VTERPENYPLATDLDSRVRVAAFAFLAREVEARGEVLPRVIEIRNDILEEEDGPMLRHGLQGFQGERITVPGSARLKPQPDFLAERYELFRKAS